MPLSLLLLSYPMSTCQCNETRKIRVIIIGKEENKCTHLFFDVYIENPNKIQDIVEEFSNIAGYTTNVLKSVHSYISVIMN